MKTWVFAKRNIKEMLRDPLNLSFGIGFPIVLLLLLTLIQNNIPVSLFELNNLTPGIAVFGLSFISLFSATLISKDRSSSFLSRLFTAPMKSWDYILGYTLPLIPMALAQGIACYAFALVIGLKWTNNIFISLVLLIPASVVFIGIGLLCGSLLNDKQAGGVCGALLTNLTAWLSGTWFDLELVGGPFKKVAYSLPFVHAVDMGKAVMAGNYNDIFPHLWWVLGYAVVMVALSIFAFRKKMKLS